MLAVLARLTFAAREAGTLAHLALRFGAGGTKRAGSWFVVHCNIRRPLMRIKLLVAAAGFAAFATPSLAAEFYIVQDTTTKRCTIVEQRPTTQTMVVVGPGMAFTTRAEAETSMKTVKVCESGGTVGGPVAPAVPR
jgi:hypothetical protein